MAAIVWADVTAHAPTLSSVTEGAQGDILADVNTRLRVSEFGGEGSPKLKMARIYLAAHSGTLSLLGATGASGTVTREKAGGLEREYSEATGSTGASDYGSTLWGQLFMGLLNSIPAQAGLLL